MTTGTVVQKDGAYFLEVEGKLQAIPVGPNLQAAQIKELVGHKVEVVHSEPVSFVVGLIPVETAKIHIPRVTCYIPVPELWTFVVDEVSRVALAQQLLNRGLVSKANYDKLAAK